MNAYIIVFGSAIWIGVCCLWFLLRQVRKDIKILISYDKHDLYDVLILVKDIHRYLDETKDTHKKIDSIIERLEDIELLLENEK